MPLVINGEVLDDALLQTERTLVRQNLPAELLIADPRYVAEWVDRAAQHNLLSRVVLDQAARRSSVEILDRDVDAELKRRRGSAQSTICSPGERAAIAHQLRIDRLLSRATKSVREPGREELYRYYKANPSRFQAPERIHVRHIIRNLDETSSEQDVLAVLQQAQRELQQGLSFAEVANRFSDCGGNGGELGWIARGEMVEEFDAAVFSLQPGEISTIFRTRFGFHLAQLIERRPPGLQPFEEVRLALAAQVLESRKQAAVSAYIQELMHKAEIHRTSE